MPFFGKKVCCPILPWIWLTLDTIKKNYLGAQKFPFKVENLKESIYLVILWQMLTDL